MAAASPPFNPLLTSWYDSVWLPILNQNNVMEYFAQRSNPFYDRTCNNEVIKMQRGDPAQLINMIGIEYSLLLVQEPILYVIRKVHRQSPEKVMPLSDYYVLGGVVYQCPDLYHILNSRLLSCHHYLQQAFDEIYSYARYNPSTGYYWKFPSDSEKGSGQKPSGSASNRDDPSDDQKKRVDGLLVELLKGFPPKVFQSKDGSKPEGILGGKDTPTKGKDLSLPPVGSGSITDPKGTTVTSSGTNDGMKPPEIKKRKPGTMTTPTFT